MDINMYIYLIHRINTRTGAVKLMLGCAFSTMEKAEYEVSRLHQVYATTDEFKKGTIFFEIQKLNVE